MKQRKLLSKITSVVCALALVVTSVTAWDVTSVSADTTTTVYQANDDGRAELLSEVQDGEINFALNKEASVSKQTTQEGGTDLGIITNGKFDNGNSKSTIIEVGRGVKEDRWVQVDLGAAYDSSKIDRVVAMYKTLNSGPTTATVGTYMIQYSLNGLNYVDIAEVSGIAGATNAIYMDKVTMTDEQKAAIPYTRFVRIYATRDLSAYGMQIKGMAVLTDGATKVSEVEFKEVETLDDPVSLTVTTSDYEQLEFTFEASEGDKGDYVYYAYIDGTQKEEAVIPGITYVETGITGGNHIVRIVAVKDGVKSKGITQAVDVVDTKSLLTSERNFAIGKTASASSIRENDNVANITDGSLTTLFRTAVTDTESTIVIDLGQNYKLDVIERTVGLYAAGRYPKSYTIDYSSNGVDFETVAEAEGKAEVQSVVIDPAQCTLASVRYVRFSLSDPVGAGYGFQMNELGVIIKEDADMIPVEVEKLDDPVSLTVTSSDYEQLEYSFEASEGDTGDYTYYVYIDGKKKEEPVLPGTVYVETGLAGGTHSVRIMAFRQGIASEGIIEEIQVADPKGLIETDRNIALGRTAVASSTRVEIVNGEEVPDNIANLTDGKLNTQFRTLQTESEANIVIDLGANYKLNIIELVAMSYINDRYAKEYSIDYSEDGETFETVCTATGNGTFQYSKINPSECTLSSVRYVRVNVSQPFAEGFGFQFYEIAVITKDKSLDDTDITLNQLEYTYTGEEILPDVTITFGDRELEIDKDFTIKGTDNINVGTATAVIEGAGSYAGSKTLQYTITPADMKDAVVTTSFEEDGNIQVSVSYNDKELSDQKDYTYTTEKNADGDMLIKVSAAGNNFVGQAEKIVPITDFPVSEAANVSVTSTEINKIDVSFENPDTFAGDRQVYDVFVDDTLADENVTAGSYTYEKQNAGEHNIKVVAKINGQTSEGVEKSVIVQGIDISAFKIAVAVPETEEGYVYTGDVIAPDCTVGNEDGTIILQENVDYIIVFEDNTNAGTAKILVTGIGLYEGTLEGSFDIQQKDINKINVDFAKVNASYNYSGKPIEPVVSVEGLQKDTDYTITISDNVNPGTAKIVVNGIGNYKGEVVKTFTIIKKEEPKTQTTKKISIGKAKVVSASKKKTAKKISLKLKKIKGAKKYQVVIAKDKKCRKVLVKKTIKKIKVTIKNKKLANKKKLYVKTRAVKVVSGKTYYGKWSTVKRVKIK